MSLENNDVASLSVVRHSISKRKKHTDEKNTPKPFLKWAGGKKQLLGDIRCYYPFNQEITKYAEPFVGGGAVLFDVLSRYELEAVYISDINKELINAYQTVKDNVEALIQLLEKYQEDYYSLDMDSRKDYYMKQRERFNKLKASGEEGYDLERASLIIFLNRTCFNGLFRVNKKGLFNVPIGAYKKPIICDADNLRLVSHKLQNVTMVCGDFKDSAEFIDENTFVYFDPPYRPLTTSASFTAYNESDFNDESQKELAVFAKAMANKGAKVLLSNSDPKNVNEDDNFFEDIYADFNIQRVGASRMINSKASKRGKISELLISNIEGSGIEVIKGGKGGGNTKTGLVFEGKTDLATFLNKQKGYRVTEGIVFYNDEKVARIFKKHGFYTFLEEAGVDWKKIISKKLLPDDSIYIIVNNTLFIIECKYQQVEGSVDEKLQTCDFKRKQYQKLMSQLNIEVEYIYLLADWFRNPKYKDVLDYIISVNCHYYFEYIPLAKFGLPVPPTDEEA